ncbi:MAG TPA: hypothetical protein VK386_00945 [Acidimicrobiales bacterium]|nr:hypothetical protein [Acidimicrobiales bacterium]
MGTITIGSVPQVPAGDQVMVEAVMGMAVVVVDPVLGDELQPANATALPAAMATSHDRRPSGERRRRDDGRHAGTGARIERTP